MPRIANILTRVRDTLADPRSERWTDAQLLRLLDEGQQVFCETARLLRARTTIEMAGAVSEYALPASAFKLVRVLDSVTQSVLPVLSHEEADATFGPGWELHSGYPEKAIIYNHQNSASFKVYPTPTNLPLVTAAQRADFASRFGAYTAGPLGLSATATPWGVVTAVLSSTNFVYLTVYYLGKPLVVTALTDQLDIDPRYDRALKFYVTGMALRDSHDAQNQKLSASELSFFQMELREAMNSSAHDFKTDASGSQLDSPYVGAF